ncbi:hypothetical protein RB597_002512 [Gaeumannomyces tritici]
MPADNSRSSGGGSSRRRARESLREQRVPSSSARSPSPPRSTRHSQRPHHQQQQQQQQQYLPVPQRGPSAHQPPSLHDNDNFAATRSLFEIDDASSFMSTARTHHDPDVVVDVPAEQAVAVLLKEPLGYVSRDWFELLCLPRHGQPSPAQVRAAYARLFRLLDAELQEDESREMAAAYLTVAQAACEALVDPSRRAEYLEDLALRAGETSLVGVDDHDDHVPPSAVEAQRLLRLRRKRRLLASIESSTDLAVRADATSVTLASLTGPSPPDVRPLDFSLGHSTVVPLPALGRLLAVALESLTLLDDEPGSELLLAAPKLTVSACSYGVLGDVSHIPTAVVTDRYQPMFSGPPARHRMVQLLINKISPLVTVGLRNELVRLPKRLDNPYDSHLRDNDWSPYDLLTIPDPEPTRVLVVENELDLLPVPAVITRVAHTIELDGGNGADPIHFEALVTAPVLSSVWRRPRAGVAVQRRLGFGTAFVCADSGELSFLSSLLGDDAATCAGVRTFSKNRLWGRGLPEALLMSPALRAYVAPTVEIGYSSQAPGELGLLGATGRPATGPIDRGFKGLDIEAADAAGAGGPGSSRGSWAVSAAATPGYATGYLRYGLELVSALPRAVTSMLPFDPKAYHMEMELCTPPAATTYPLNLGSIYGGCVAFRALRRVGARSSFGFEVGLSLSSFHLNLYWSRLAQRFRLPVLLRTNPSAGGGGVPGGVSFVTPRLAFWSVLVPMLGLAALDLARLCSRAGRVAAAREADKKRAALSMTRDELADHVARRRAEADELTALLAVGAQARQQAERQRGGLVILAAKYGVPDVESDDALLASAAPPSRKQRPTPFDPDHEVADVVVAVAALVQGGDDDDEAPGSLLIPAGLRKSRLLGFWDPAPLRTKVLQVRYAYRGREAFVEVRGREELRLPVP